MSHFNRFVRVARPTLGWVLAAGLFAGCYSSTEPTVQMNFPEGMKIPEPAQGTVVDPGAGPTSQGDPHNYTK